MKKTGTLLATLALLAGCVPTQYWVKNGVTLAQYQREQTQCEVTGAQSVPTNTQVGWAPYVGIYSADTNSGLRDRVIAQCMTDKGYQYVELPTCGSDIAAKFRSGEITAREKMLVTPQTCVISTGNGPMLYTPE